MTTYAVYTSNFHDDEQGAGYNRITGTVSGIAPGQWPRYRGRPMQHLLTLDLRGLEVGGERARRARLVTVFTESLWEMSVGDESATSVMWVSQEELDRYPISAPPDGFVADPVPDYQELAFELEARDWPVGPMDTAIGGAPGWAAGGHPRDVPDGEFVMQLSSLQVPFTRERLTLYVFEEGVLIAPQGRDVHPMIRWEDAIPRSREIVAHKEAPPPGAVQKWGGIPVGVDEWPGKLSHILTYEQTEGHPSWVNDGVAVAVFANLALDSIWDEQVDVFETRVVERARLAQPTEVPAGVVELDEKRLELRPFPGGTSWRDLCDRSVVGPRSAWRQPLADCADASAEYGLQLTQRLLPNAPDDGTLYFKGDGCYPWWIPAVSGGAPPETASSLSTLSQAATGAALVAGWEGHFYDWEVDRATLEALEKAVDGIEVSARGALRLFVPGDSCTHPNEGTCGSVVIGWEVAAVSADDLGPASLTMATLREALDAIPPAVGEEYSKILEDLVSDFRGLASTPRIHLVSWGPLCDAAVHIGIPLPSEKAESARYEFSVNQNLCQEQAPLGVDGVRLSSCAYREIASLSVAPSATKDYVARVSSLESPELFLLCGYDR